MGLDKKPHHVETTEECRLASGLKKVVKQKELSAKKDPPRVTARSPFPLRTHFPSRLERIGYKCYNYLDNSLYPVHPLFFFFGCAAVSASLLPINSGLLDALPEDGTISRYLMIIAASIATAYIPVLIVRLFMRHVLLKYMDWLFENPKKPSMKTKIWATLRKLLSLVSPRFQSCDSLLPSQPIPALEETVQRYLASIRKLHSAKALEEIEAMALNFLSFEGRRLQIFTRLYGLFVENYVTGFWENLAYLSSRKPLLINSSVGAVDFRGPVEATQAFRAAMIAYVETQAHLAIDRQTYKPLAGGAICSRHVGKLYASVREPGEKTDRIRQFGISRHIVVQYRGGIYKVHVADENDRLYTPEEFAHIFIEMLTRPNSQTEGAEARVAALTTDNRIQWYHNRRRFFEEIPENCQVLRDIESAITFICLEDTDFGYDQTKPEQLSGYMRAMLAGNGANRWTDKAVNHSVARNGAFARTITCQRDERTCKLKRHGGTTEHAIADGIDYDAINETTSFIELQVLGYPPLAEQQEREERFDREQKSDLRFAERLEIKLTDEMASEIERCYAAQLAASDNLHVASLVFRKWGKDRIKQCGCSPDAFIQMAIQLANYRDQGRFVLTYESASTRFFRNSRTETLRTTGDESCAFVCAMHDEAVDRSKRAEILRLACEAHVLRNRNCMAGKGVDRHLFVLYVMAKASGIHSSFLDHYIQQEWLLSTSQVPVVTNLLNEEIDGGRFAWLGGGFGAVAQAGYGICYRVTGEQSICAHITSYRSAENTDSERFREHLVEALEQMSSLFD